MNNPPAQHPSHAAISVVMQNLPHHLGQRIAVLHSLLLMVPNSYPHKDEIVAQLNSCKSAEKYQEKFLTLLKEAA